MSERLGPPASSRGAEPKLLACAAMMAAAVVGRAPLGLTEGPDRPSYDTQAQADAESIGCISCHTATDRKSMHTGDVILSCVDCHGGNGLLRAQGGPGSPGQPPKSWSAPSLHGRQRPAELPGRGRAGARAMLQGTQNMA